MDDYKNWYSKLNYYRYQDKLCKLLNNTDLQKLGIQKYVIGKSVYGYNLDLITIGFGEKELFLVGGTHGSEIIGVDFLLHFISSLPTLEDFDPNLFKLVILPLQNPEGFDISSNTFSWIDDGDFEEKSYEYYLRYRLDSILANAFDSFYQFLSGIINCQMGISANEFLKMFQYFILHDMKWCKLYDKHVTPEMNLFCNLSSSIKEVKSYSELQLKLIQICDQVLSKSSKNQSLFSYVTIILSSLKNVFSNDFLWKEAEKNKLPKLYQNMFETIGFSGVMNPKMAFDVEKMYQEYNHPMGSQIGHDSTGIGINLNANQPLNPGILSRLENRSTWGIGVKNNIQNYSPGPLGVPCLEKEHFSSAVENVVLEKLIANSYQSGKFLGCFLYHGTGGLIYYKPYQDLMDDNTYQEFYDYNREIANIYQRNTDYNLLSISDTTGYGDYLRRTYPGVLLIELSKMGGNPLGPYGDINNICKVFDDNSKALNSIFSYFKSDKKSRTRKKNSNYLEC